MADKGEKLNIKRFWTVFLLLVTFFVLGACVENQPEPTDLLTTQTQSVAKKVTTSSDSRANSLQAGQIKFQKKINGFKLGMSVDDFKLTLKSKNLNLYKPSPQTDDGRTPPYEGRYVFQIQGYSFIFNSSDTLYYINVWPDNLVK